MAGRKPFSEWSFSAVFAVASGVLILCLFSLTNGQTFPLFMAIGLPVLLVLGIVTTYAKNTEHGRAVKAIQAPATFIVLVLGVGVLVSARPADAVTREITIADVTSSFERYRGSYYELTATDGSYYSLTESDFQPQLPPLDNPRYRGHDALLTLERGTAGVLGVRLDGVDYLTATYVNHDLKLLKGVAIGSLLVLTAVGMALAFGYFSLLARAFHRT